MNVAEIGLNALNRTVNELGMEYFAISGYKSKKLQ